MSAFFGMSGQLFEVKCPAAADRTIDRPHAFIRTLAGRVKGMAGQASRRSWTLDVAVGSPQDVSTVEALARTLGPLSWYGPEATVGNLLSPQASSWEPVPTNATAAGLVLLPDGTTARSITASGTVRVGAAHGAYEMVPVRPGVSVSVGAWAQGGLGFQGYWRDATGAQMTTYLVSAVTHSGWKWRQSVLTPPAGAAYVELQLFGGTAYALPSVSWGAAAKPELGAGCPKAVVHSVGVSPIAAHSRLNIGRVGYQVQEVG